MGGEDHLHSWLVLSFLSPRCVIVYPFVSLQVCNNMHVQKCNLPVAEFLNV